MPYDPNWRWSPTAISLDEPNSVHSFDRWALNGWHYFFQVHPGIGKWCEIGLLGWWAGNGRTEDTVLENYVALWLTCFGGVHWWKKLVFHSQATQECIFGKICTDAGFSLDVWVHMWGCRDEKNWYSIRRLPKSVCLAKHALMQDFPWMSEHSFLPWFFDVFVWTYLMFFRLFIVC